MTVNCPGQPGSLSLETEQRINILLLEPSIIIAFNSNENGGINSFDEEIGGLVGMNGFLKDSLADDLKL